MQKQLQQTITESHHSLAHQDLYSKQREKAIESLKDQISSLSLHHEADAEHMQSLSKRIEIFESRENILEVKEKQVFME